MPTHSLVKFCAVLALPAVALTALSFHLSSSIAAASNPSATIRSTSASPNFLAQQSRVRRVRFAPGKTSAVINDAVIRGTRDLYLLGASRGQTMTVKIFSLENNAEFEILAPPNKAGQRRTLKAGTVNWTGTLPATGDYQVVIGATRGNAAYKLQITIE